MNILFFGDLSDGDVRSYYDSLLKAGNGAGPKNDYVPDADGLIIQINAVNSASDDVTDVERYFADFYCTLVVVVITHGLIRSGGGAFWRDLRHCYMLASGENARCAILPVLVDERAQRDFVAKGEDNNNGSLFDRFQFLSTSKFGERAERSAMFALHVLHNCRKLLGSAQSVSNRMPRLRFFISHAKLDGLPLAESIRHLIADKLKWEDFYDADDIGLGEDWRKALEKGVRSSVLIALRTNNYDRREWCRQELQWCEAYACPAVCVDARTDLSFPPRGLPFEKYPVIRIADGNLLRVLFLAIREDLRFMLFDAQVLILRASGVIPRDAAVVTFGCRPPCSAIIHACGELENSHAGRKLIVYPDPPMERDEYEALVALVEKYAPEVELTTPDTLTMQMGASR